MPERGILGRGGKGDGRSIIIFGKDLGESLAVWRIGGRRQEMLVRTAGSIISGMRSCNNMQQQKS